MQSTIIDGVIWQQLKIIEDDRGAVLHMVRSDNIGGDGFGEIYFSELKFGVIKGWKMHYRMTQRLSVPFGLVRFHLFDGRKDSMTYGSKLSLVIGRPNFYGLLRIPPGIWYAFENIEENISIVANCADMIHDPGESTTLPINDRTLGFCASRLSVDR
jgi:dTDP-4-dehydrorhamnose 3,5-epimerase